MSALNKRELNTFFKQNINNLQNYNLHTSFVELPFYGKFVPVPSRVQQMSNRFVIIIMFWWPKNIPLFWRIPLIDNYCQTPIFIKLHNVKHLLNCTLLCIKRENSKLKPKNGDNATTYSHFIYDLRKDENGTVRQLARAMLVQTRLIWQYLTRHFLKTFISIIFSKNIKIRFTLSMDDVYPWF